MRKLTVLVVAWTAAVTAAERYPTPRFSDPERRSKLESAFPELDRMLDSYRTQRGIPGLVYGVVIDGETAHVHVSGVRDVPANAPVTPDTVFRIASMTKSFTTLAILKLRDEGRLSLDDPAAKWVPELAGLEYPTRDTAPITIRQLLTHGAGFPEDNPWGDRQLAASDQALAESLKKGLPFSTPPRTAYEYSNYGFALLGRIVAKASAVTYREYVEQQILKPLGMRASTLDPSAVPPAQLSHGYGKTGDSYQEVPALAHGAFGSMGGMLTSARDLGRYVAYQLSAYPPRDDQELGPVRRSSMREMQSLWRADRFTGTSFLGYGYGLRISSDCRFAHIVGHGGGLPGWGSYMIWLPDYGVGLFAMTNLTYAGPGGLLSDALDVLRKTGGLEPRQLPPSQALVDTRAALLRLWEHWDDAEFEALAANNLALDSPAAARKKGFEEAQAEFGACRADGDVQPENWLRGKFRMRCEKGTLEISFTLSPTSPPKVQSFRVEPSRSPQTPCAP
jgi:CubicO group peptidase (beta-lactamase class C family)